MCRTVNSIITTTFLLVFSYRLNERTLILSGGQHKFHMVHDCISSLVSMQCITNDVHDRKLQMSRLQPRCPPQRALLYFPHAPAFPPHGTFSIADPAAASRHP